tara:strand:+ start:356 stop:943 length:588 start_codon:yes stop_codon:yes gene_type:complete
MVEVVRKYPHIDDELAKRLSATYQKSVAIDDSPFESRNLAQSCFNILHIIHGSHLCMDEWHHVRTLYDRTCYENDRDFAVEIKNSEVYSLFAYNVLCIEWEKQEQPRISLDEWRAFLHKVHTNGGSPAAGECYEAFENTNTFSSDSESDESDAGGGCAASSSDSKSAESDAGRGCAARAGHKRKYVFDDSLEEDE